MKALQQLVAIVQRVLLGIVHDLDALERVGVTKRHEQDEAAYRKNRQQKDLPVEAGKQQHHGDRRRDDERGALVGLYQDETGGKHDAGGAHDAELPEVDLAVREVPLAERRRAEKDDGLGELGRLQLDALDDDPTHGTLGLDAEKARVDEKRHDAEGEPRDRPGAAEPAVADQDDDSGEHQADREQRRLTLEQVARVTGLLEHRDRACRVDHDEAEQAQRADHQAEDDTRLHEAGRHHLPGGRAYALSHARRPRARPRCARRRAT